MMDNPAARLDGPRGVADDVQHGYIFTKCSANATQSAQLTRSKCGDQRAEPFLACVAIGGIRTDEFVGCSDPREALFRNQVEKGKLKVWSEGIRQSLKDLDLVFLEVEAQNIPGLYYGELTTRDAEDSLNADLLEPAK